MLIGKFVLKAAHIYRIKNRKCSLPLWLVYGPSQPINCHHSLVALVENVLHVAAVTTVINV